MGLQELLWRVQTPLTSNGKIDIDGVVAVSIQNMGDGKVMLDNDWTVKPDSTLQIGVFQLNGIFAQQINVKFDTASTVKRLEVSFLYAKDHPSNYPSNC